MQHLEAVIRAKIPSIVAMINKTIDEIEAQLDKLGRPIGGDAGVRTTVSWWFVPQPTLFINYYLGRVKPLCIIYF